MNLPLNKEYLDGIAFFCGKALERSGNDRPAYLDKMLDYRKICARDMLEDMEKALEKAVDDRDYESVQRLLFTYYHTDLTIQGCGGYDHSHVIFQMIPYLSCAAYENIFRALPKELPLSENGHTMCINGTNLLLCTLYPGVYDTEKVLKNAEKHVNSKQPKWDRAFVACLLGILKNDAELFSQNVQLLCELHSRVDLPKFVKVQCVYAYGMLVIAKHNMSADAFEKIKMPEYKNFDIEYLNYIFEGHFSKEPVYTHDEAYKEFDYLYDILIPITELYQPYLDKEAYTKRERNKYYMDSKSMNAQIISEILKREN